MLSPIAVAQKIERSALLITTVFLPHRQAGQSALRLASLPAYGAKTPSSIQYLPVKLRFSPRPLSTSMSSVALAKEEALAAAGLRLGGEPVRLLFSLAL